MYGRAIEDGLWGGWLVFFPVDGGRVIATARESTQSSFADLSYWASGLTHVYLEGALERALDLEPEVQLARELDELERIEASAESRAAILEREATALEQQASAARAESRLVEAVRERTEERFLEEVAGSAAAEADAHEQAASKARSEAHAADRALRARQRSRSSPKKK